MQSLLRLAFPPQCLVCSEGVDDDFGLCGACWRDTPFITGLVCDSCGVPLPGRDEGVPVHCDDCLTIARPWKKGRAALAYSGAARKLILGLKHGDRHDLVSPFARWMAAVAPPLLHPDTVIVPVPLHNVRLIKRRYNQAALLGTALARILGQEIVPDLLVRTKSTRAQEGMTRQDRFTNQAQAIAPARHARRRLAGRSVLLVDDVMTSGATLAAAAEACHAAGAAHVNVLALARVVKEA